MALLKPLIRQQRHAGICWHLQETVPRKPSEMASRLVFCRYSLEETVHFTYATKTHIICISCPYVYTRKVHTFYR